MEEKLSVAHVADWTGEDVTVDEVERELAALRAGSDEHADLLTRVLTHVAWVPDDWIEAAREVLAGLAERHPSRLILLRPQPDEADGLDAAVTLQCFSQPGMERHFCAETVELALRGSRAHAPASIVLPLLVPDLPVFLRWRGEPPFGERPFEELVDTVDRVVLDSGEWESLPAAFSRLLDVFERAAVSDIAWARTLRWRRALAAAWPGIAHARELRVAGPRADALLLAGWLSSRLPQAPALVHDEAEEIELVAVDADRVDPPPESEQTASDLLSAELDRFSRDPVYEQAVAGAVESSP